MYTAQKLAHALQQLANTAIATHSQRFFKTGPGEYGEGDLFLGIRVPVLRKQARIFKTMPASEVVQALHSPHHEIRLCALLVWVLQFQKANDSDKKIIYDLYMANTRYVNNWDLVDTSAHPIVGGYLQDKSRDPLVRLAQSDLLWERRIAMIATYHFIKQSDFQDALRVAGILVADPQDLIQKAVGWMLREVGNRNGSLERAFLKAHYRDMGRTALRYAIEKFPPEERLRWQSGKI
ncbi:MAG: DNA alkylation repair protein [Acidobacteria bacterium]|nr:DNA alkylation repair protein [Acidobacteriota bacterium]